MKRINFDCRTFHPSSINCNKLIILRFAEDFNKRIMTPELSTEEIESLHKEATDLYDTYFRSNAKHKVNVNQDIAMDIFKSKFCVKLRCILLPQNRRGTPGRFRRLYYIFYFFSFERTTSQRHSIKNYDTIVYGI